MKNLILILMVPLLVMACTNCGAVKEQARATADTVVDCTKAEAADAIATYAPTLEQVLRDNADNAGRLDWDRVKAATRTYATNAAKCVLASTIARLLKPPGVDPNAPQSSPLVLEPLALQAGWDELRREQFGGARFKLADATL